MQPDRDEGSVKGMLGFCWCTYVVTYLCRVNFSSALEKLADGLETSTEALGIAGSSFFLFYAAGQLFNGFMGEKVSPYKMVTAAILSTGLINLQVSMCDNYTVILFLWSANGFAQSMIWGPMMRILARNYSPEQNIKISARMSTSMVWGYLLSWAVFGGIFIHSAWEIYFAVPSVLALVFFLIWRKISVNRSQEEKKDPKKSKYSVRGVFKREKLCLVALICFGMGLMKESLSLWAPVLMTQMMQMETQNSLICISVIPIANFLGIFLAKKLLEKTGNVEKTLGILFASAGVCSIILRFGYQSLMVVSVILMAAVSGLMYGCNSVLLSYLPISYKRYHIVTNLVGVFDFMSYTGAAFSSVILGISIGSGRYEQIFGMWILTSAVSVIFIGGLSAGKRSLREQCKYEKNCDEVTGIEREEDYENENRR